MYEERGENEEVAVGVGLVVARTRLCLCYAFFLRRYSVMV